jgi:hypothetical protein
MNGSNTMNEDKRYIAILINPKGEECFLAYGPTSKNKGDAIRFVSFGVAHGAAILHFGRGDQGFWDCEREAARNAEIEYRGWTSRVEEAA